MPLRAPRPGPTLVALLAIGFAALAGPAIASSQTCAAGRNGRFRLRTIPKTMAFASPGIVDFDVGSIQFTGFRVRVRPRFSRRRTWTLCLRSRDVILGGNAKPIGELEWRLAGSGAWLPVGLTDQLVFIGKGRKRVDVDFRVLLAWASDIPANYSARLAFTAYEQ